MAYDFPNAPTIGQTTPDGAWYWDGATWVPVGNAGGNVASLDGTNIFTGDNQFDGGFNVGDPGAEIGGVLVNGTLFPAVAKINQFGTGVQAELVIHRHSDNDEAHLVFSRSNSIDAAHGNVANGNSIGDLVFTGWNTDSYYWGASIRALVDGTPGIGDMPSRLDFLTSADGTAAPVVGMSVRANGNVDIANDINMGVNLITDTKVGGWDAHVASVANPHGVTAAQAGADPVGSAAAVQTNLDTHVGDLANPHAVTAAQAGAEPDLGNPATDGEVLTSTTLGVRSWAPDKVVPDGGDQGQIIVKQSATEQDAAWINLPIGFSSHWVFDSSTVAGDPGLGTFRLNAATRALTTEIYIDDETAAGLDISSLFPELNVGGKLIFAESGDVTSAGFYEISAPPTDNGTWYTIPVTFIDAGSGGELQAGKDVVFQFLGVGGASVTGWGEIVGTLSNQTDLQAALDLKPNTDPTGVTGADAVTNIISLTQVEYDAIATPDASTLYVISG